MNKKAFLFLLTISFLFTACFEDLDDNEQVASTLDIQNFIYSGLNYYYLYKSATPELANDAFANQEELNAFLDNYDSPESLFNYLRAPQDRFSILVDDYIALENALSGVSRSNGMEYGLVLYPDGSNNVFGYVRYVLPNTSAEAMGLERGVIFNTVDGQQLVAIPDGNGNLTVDTSVFASETYTIGLADFDGNDVTPTGESVTLTKEQYTENPVFIANTLTIEGQQVGYLMYNSFIRSFAPELNAAFAQFQADGVTQLIIDLRYNGGGSVETATDLASMITGQFNGQVFYNEEWNDDRQEEFASPGLFDSSISTTGEAINSLNLDQVYFITSSRTASASELLINGLTPYIDLNQVGEATTGKYQASFLLYDAPAPNFSRNEANPAHTYAMLPLVFKTANVAGNTDYDNGLQPDVEISEDFSNLGTLGDPDEPLLAAALNQIFPTRAAPNKNIPQLEVISESKATSPLYQLMIAEQE